MRRIITILWVAASSLAAAAEFPEEDISFFREEVRPLLEEHCFRCHGGADQNGKVKVRSGLQLISRKGILIGGDHGPAFDVEDPAKSRLLYVLTYEDDDLKMPPRGKLEPETAAIFAEWVKRGLPWTPEDADRLVEMEEDDAEITTINEHTKSHWSYRAMTRPEVPSVDDDAWAGPIDAFIYEKVREIGLTPNAAASRGELIRRAAYNMTGLPPTLEEVQVFEKDSTPDAWEKVVDRLLASPGYGEKWGRHWLDLVRYAETHGFERDTDKPQVWRYRDYVINAFNADKPYDEFLREQLAGDELPSATLESMTATGYHRLMQWDDGPADRKQHYYDVLDDNLRTTTEAMLGMTMGCARCHDHKGDPISQEDYYSFMSFFRGITPMTKKAGAVEQVEVEGVEAGYELAMERHWDESARLQLELEPVEEDLTRQLLNLDSELVENLNQPGDPQIWLIADGRSPEVTSWHYTTEAPAEEWSEVDFRAEDHQWKLGPGGFGISGSEMEARTKWETPELWLQTTFLLEAVPKTVRMNLLHDESVELYLNGEPVLTREGFRRNYDEFLVEPNFLGALQTGRNVLSVHVANSSGAQYFDLGLQVGAGGLLDLDRSLRHREVRDLLDQGVWKHRRTLLSTLRKHGEKKPKRGVEEVMTATETGVTAPPTYVHIRGNANAEDEDREMQPRIPGIFGGHLVSVNVPASGRLSSGRRTALAEWICQDDNPRTARVMMNRVWQHHFGRGICPTPNDFGFLGQMPTHPELLDWLATEFVAQGWSLKAMHKQLMLSRAFQMSSRGTPEGLARDPDNNSFWRINMRRLTAEEVRDSILLVTGTLNRKMGGPSIFIPLPDAVLATSSKKDTVWGKSSPEDELRRSIYVKVKRSLIPPQFADLDMADTDASCPVRYTTTVPTQALGFLNSEFMNGQAEVFATRLRREAGPEQVDQVRLGLELALSRPASERELEYGHEFFELMRQRHGLSEDEALNRFALLVLSLNEFIFLD